MLSSFYLIKSSTYIHSQPNAFNTLFIASLNLRPYVISAYCIFCPKTYITNTKLQHCWLIKKQKRLCCGQLVCLYTITPLNWFCLWQCVFNVSYRKLSAPSAAFTCMLIGELEAYYKKECGHECIRTKGNVL